MNTLIKALMIQKNFKDLNVLSNVCLEIRKNEIVSILGRSGSGKTTLMKILAGIETPSSGDIIYEGLFKKEIGMIFQDLFIFPWLNVKKNIAFGLDNDEGENITSILNSLGLKDFENFFPHQISGGMLQRVAIGRSLIMEPKLLLMDEPFGELDFIARNDLYELIKSLNKDKDITFCFITHNIEEAFLISDRVLYLDNGNIAINITTSDLPDHMALLEHILSYHRESGTNRSDSISVGSGAKIARCIV